MGISRKIGYNFSLLMSEQHTPPIFYDPQHRRWRRFTRTVQSIAAVGSCIVAVLLVSVLINPFLPNIKLNKLKPMHVPGFQSDIVPRPPVPELPLLTACVIGERVG